MQCTGAKLTQRAVALHAFSSPWPHSDRLSMCSSSSGHVMTPGVASGATKSGQVHLGNAPTSLHMSTQTPASLFCNAARCLMSSLTQDSWLPFALVCNADAPAALLHDLSW